MMLKKGIIWLSLGLAVCWAYPHTEDLSLESSKSRMRTPSELIVSGSPGTKPQEKVQDIPGQQVYKKFCNICHSSGIAGAPKVGNHDQWLREYQTGWPLMMKRAMGGYKGMPAKGNCMKCNEVQIHEAIEYMLVLSGIEAEKS
jgi:cytochrome c5